MNPESIFVPDDIAKALWEINKAAKRERDSARAAFEDDDVHSGRAHAMSRRRFYELKDSAIKEAARKGWVSLSEVHRITGKKRFEGERSSRLFACLKISTFTFHLPINEAGSQPVVDLGEWESDASPEGQQMPLDQARKLLEDFVMTERASRFPDHIVDPGPLHVGGVCIDIGLRGPRLVDRKELSDDEYARIVNYVTELEHTAEECEQYLDHHVQELNVDQLRDERSDLWNYELGILEYVEYSGSDFVTPDLAERLEKVDRRFSALEDRISDALGEDSDHEVVLDDDLEGEHGTCACE